MVGAARKLYGIPPAKPTARRNSDPSRPRLPSTREFLQVEFHRLGVGQPPLRPPVPEGLEQSSDGGEAVAGQNQSVHGPHA